MHFARRRSKLMRKAYPTQGRKAGIVVTIKLYLSMKHKWAGSHALGDDMDVDHQIETGGFSPSGRGIHVRSGG